MKSIQVSIKCWRHHVLPESTTSGEFTGLCQPFRCEIQTDETSSPQTSRSLGGKSRGHPDCSHNPIMLLRQGLRIPLQSMVWKYSKAECRRLFWAPVNASNSVLTRAWDPLLLPSQAKVLGHIEVGFCENRSLNLNFPSRFGPMFAFWRWHTWI